MSVVVSCRCVRGSPLAPRRPTASISLALSKRRSLHAPAVPHHRSRLAAPSAGSTTAEVAPQDVLDAQQLGKWEECIKQVEALGFNAEDADGIVGRAFGWGSQAYWRQEKVQQPPEPGHVADVLAFLSKQGLSQEDVAKVVKALPEVIAFDVAPGRLSDAVATLEGTWKLTGDVLARTLVRRPQVLGYTLDCEGNCIGDCNKCWARF